MSGIKHDADKVRVELLPPDALLAIADVLTFGAAKYGDRNWETGLRFGRLYAAALRHLLAWWSGEELDPETGKPHLAHAACCVTMLLALTERGMSRLDDRPKATIWEPGEWERVVL